MDFRPRPQPASFFQTQQADKTTLENLRLWLKDLREMQDIALDKTVRNFTTKAIRKKYQRVFRQFEKAKRMIGTSNKFKVTIGYQELFYNWLENEIQRAEEKIELFSRRVRQENPEEKEQYDRLLKEQIRIGITMNLLERIIQFENEDKDATPLIQMENAQWAFNLYPSTQWKSELNDMDRKFVSMNRKREKVAYLTALIRFLSQYGNDQMEAMQEYERKLDEAMDMDIDSDDMDIECSICSERAQYKCGGCMTTLYCSAQCQKQDWGRHHTICQ
jgi:hypothetical protein